MSYGASGVCRITDIRKERILDKLVECYVLTPVKDERTTIFVPISNRVLVNKMQPLLTPEEIKNIFAESDGEPYEWIEEDRKRSDTFRKILTNGTRDDFIKIIHILRSHQAELAANGKKLRPADKALLNQLEKRILDEMALVLGIEPSQVEDYVFQTLGT